MSNRPTELEAAALTSSWSVAQQAALYHIHLAQQAEKDEQEALKKKEEREQKKMEEMVKPEEVDAGEIVDGWVSSISFFFAFSLLLCSFSCLFLRPPWMMGTNEIVSWYRSTHCVRPYTTFWISWARRTYSFPSLSSSISFTG